MHDCGAEPENVLANCGFESGDFTSWATQDIPSPFLPLTVDTAGAYIGYGFFSSAPTEGTMAALHGFDGAGPGTIEIGQDFTVPAFGGTLEFDYRGAWDLASFGATEDRTFEVQIEPAGGGTPMQTDLILTAPAGDLTTDTGPLSGTVDLSAFGAQDVRVNFVWTVPEMFSGPGFFQLDNVQVTENELLEVPTTDWRGLVILVALLSGAAFWLLAGRRG